MISSMMESNDISVWVAGLKLWPLIFMLFINLSFRRLGKPTGVKRMASLFQAIGVFILTSLASYIAGKNLSDVYFFAGTAVLVALAVFFRNKIFPYRLRCVRCAARLDFRTIYYNDENLCSGCSADVPADTGE